MSLSIRNLIRNQQPFCLAMVFALICFTVSLSAEVSEQKKESSQVESQQLLKSMVGEWTGTCKTWFQPGKLADESNIQGEMKWMYGGKFLRHTYTGSIQGKPRHGEETLIFSPVIKQLEVSWIDDFHMSTGIMLSKGLQADNRFEVLGKYEVGSGQPAWGWRTVYEIVDEDHLTITAFNVSPEGQEAKAVETRYTRVKSNADSR